jgi:hypothetical protein
MEIMSISIDKLEPNLWNPNEMREEGLLRLYEEIKENGFLDPIQVVPLDNGMYRIIGGEHRFRAAQLNGLEVIPCVVLSEEKWKDEDLQKLVTVRLNVLKGKLNPDKMVGLYQEMAGKYGEESLQQMFAYVDKDGWNKLVKGVSKGLKGVLPKKARSKLEASAENMSAMEDLSLIIKHLFEKYGSTLQYSFMVFTWEGKEHLYVAMSEKMKKAMDEIQEYCCASGEDINEVMASLTQEWVEGVRQERAVRG